jgi:glycosyltransferase involved in cell wall biosynthesis
MVGLCGNLVETGYNVTLATLDAPGSASFYHLDHRVKTVGTDALGGSHRWDRLRRIGGRFAKIRRLARQDRPDVILSFMDTMNITVLLATRGLGVPVIVSERVDPAAHRHRIGRFKSVLRRMTYPWADRVVVQTRRARSFFSNLVDERISILPNPIARSEKVAAPERAGSDRRFRIIGVGRLDPQKGFDLLIEAFGLVAADFPDWDVVIFGEGPERSALARRVAELGLKERVVLPGVTAAIEDEYCRAHILAFASRYEGFPNSFAEAMAAGLPAVAFEGVSGVEDLAVPRRTALLAPLGDVGAFSRHLATLMAYPKLRGQLGKAARDRIAEFSPTAVYAEWRRIVEEAAAKKTVLSINGPDGKPPANP